MAPCGKRKDARASVGGGTVPARPCDTVSRAGDVAACSCQHPSISGRCEGLGAASMPGRSRCCSLNAAAWGWD